MFIQSAVTFYQISTTKKYRKKELYKVEVALPANQTSTINDIKLVTFFVSVGGGPFRYSKREALQPVKNF